MKGCAVIPRGADLRAFSPASVDLSRVARLRADWGVQPHERVALVAARLTGWKGQKVLIEAVSRIKAQGLDDVRYILAGDAQGRDGYVKELDTLIAKLELKGIVLRVGHCSDMPAALTRSERRRRALDRARSFGRSAVEAQAMGAMVVVSDIGAVPETVLAPPEVAEGRAHRLAHPARRPRRARRGADDRAVTLA